MSSVKHLEVIKSINPQLAKVYEKADLEDDSLLLQNSTESYEAFLAELVFYLIERTAASYIDSVVSGEDFEFNLETLLQDTAFFIITRVTDQVNIAFKREALRKALINTKTVASRLEQFNIYPNDAAINSILDMSDRLYFEYESFGMSTGESLACAAGIKILALRRLAEYKPETEERVTKEIKLVTNKAIKTLNHYSEQWVDYSSSTDNIVWEKKNIGSMGNAKIYNLIPLDNGKKVRYLDSKTGQYKTCFRHVIERKDNGKKTYIDSPETGALNEVLNQRKKFGLAQSSSMLENGSALLAKLAEKFG